MPNPMSAVAGGSGSGGSANGVLLTENGTSSKISALSTVAGAYLHTTDKLVIERGGTENYGVTLGGVILYNFYTALKPSPTNPLNHDSTPGAYGPGLGIFLYAGNSYNNAYAGGIFMRGGVAAGTVAGFGGGNVHLYGGPANPGAGAGGFVNIAGGFGYGSVYGGGHVYVQGGSGLSGASGGRVLIQGGEGVLADGNGGPVTIQGGFVNAGTGNSGAIEIYNAHAGPLFVGQANGVNIHGTNFDGTIGGNGGFMQVKGGFSTGDGGAAYLNGGYGATNGGNGGDAGAVGGDAFGAGKHGGHAYLQGGFAASGADGGSAIVTGGNVTAGAGVGGIVRIAGGTNTAGSHAAVYLDGLPTADPHKVGQLFTDTVSKAVLLSTG